jgi:hypothetical protein
MGNMVEPLEALNYKGCAGRPVQAPLGWEIFVFKPAPSPLANPGLLFYNLTNWLVNTKTIALLDTFEVQNGRQSSPRPSGITRTA